MQCSVFTPPEVCLLHFHDGRGLSSVRLTMLLVVSFLQVVTEQVLCGRYFSRPRGATGTKQVFSWVFLLLRMGSGRQHGNKLMSKLISENDACYDENAIKNEW